MMHKQCILYNVKLWLKVKEIVPKWKTEDGHAKRQLFCLIFIVRFRAIRKVPKILILWEIADVLQRSPNSFAMNLHNFFSLNHDEPGGLGNISKLDREVREEFHQDWESLVYQSEQIIEKLKPVPFVEAQPAEDATTLPLGLDKITEVKTRVNQSFFRDVALSA